MTLWRAVMGRVRSDASFLVGVWLLVVCAITLLAAGSLYAETVEVGSLAAALRSADPANQGVEVRTSAPPSQVTGLDATISRDIRAALAATGARVVLEARSGSLRPVGISGSASQQLIVLSSAADLASHVSLVNGRWPDPGHDPVEATLSEGAAAALGLAVGGTMGLADASAPGADASRPLVSVVVTGVWRPLPDDPIWLGDRLVPLRLMRAAPGERDRRVQELLELVGLGRRMRHRPHELSGGEQQRVSIARALANRPRLLLADEPTGQLDSETGRTIMSLLRAVVRSEGVTAIVATHDPLMLDVADRVVELRDGTLVEDAVRP